MKRNEWRDQRLGSLSDYKLVIVGLLLPKARGRVPRRVPSVPSLESSTTTYGCLPAGDHYVMSILAKEISSPPSCPHRPHGYWLSAQLFAVPFSGGESRLASSTFQPQMLGSSPRERVASLVHRQSVLQPCAWQSCGNEYDSLRRKYVDMNTSKHNV